MTDAQWRIDNYGRQRSNRPERTLLRPCEVIGREYSNHPPSSAGGIGSVTPRFGIRAAGRGLSQPRPAIAPQPGRAGGKARTFADAERTRPRRTPPGVIDVVPVANTLGNAPAGRSYF